VEEGKSVLDLLYVLLEFFSTIGGEIFLKDSLAGISLFQALDFSKTSVGEFAFKDVVGIDISDIDMVSCALLVTHWELLI